MRLKGSWMRQKASTLRRQNLSDEVKRLTGEASGPSHEAKRLTPEALRLAAEAKRLNRVVQRLTTDREWGFECEEACSAA